MLKVLTDHDLAMWPKLDRVAKLRALFGFAELDARLLDAFIATCVETEREECAKLVEHSTADLDLKGPQDLREAVGEMIRDAGKVLASSIRDRGKND